MQLLTAPGNEVGSGDATWGRATADRVDGFGFDWEWDGKSSKHIHFDWSGPQGFSSAASSLPLMGPLRLYDLALP